MLLEPPLLHTIKIESILARLRVWICQIGKPATLPFIPIPLIVCFDEWLLVTVISKLQKIESKLKARVSWVSCSLETPPFPLDLTKSKCWLKFQLTSFWN